MLIKFNIWAARDDFLGYKYPKYDVVCNSINIPNINALFYLHCLLLVTQSIIVTNEPHI